MKIWTITYNDDNGVDTTVVNTEAEAEKLAQDWVAHYFEGKPRPEDWRDGLELLRDQPCFMDSIDVIEHIVLPPDNSDNPYVKAAIRREKEGELEIDSTALVSEGDDTGAYVQAWIWVPDDEL